LSPSTFFQLGNAAAAAVRITPLSCKKSLNPDGGGLILLSAKPQQQQQDEYEKHRVRILKC